jgi:serine/threonine protein kinase, bacterial
VEGTLFGRYRLVELLGRGGMGEVWRAHDTVTDRIVALKLLPEHLAHDEMFQQRFRREALAAARLNEPHVVPIHNFGEIDGRLYVDMRLIEGRDLQSMLGAGQLAPSRAVNIVEQVAMALHAAHKVGLVHRDVKPSNILVGEFDFAYLIDFGIARDADQTALTSTGAMIGTLYYMAPERFKAGPIDRRVDIYALACVLHECLTGSRPFPGDSLESQLGAHLTAPPPRPSDADSGVPAAFDEVIAKGMAKDPDERYATTMDLAKAAHSAITTPISPKPSPYLQQPRAAELAEGSVSPTIPDDQSPTRSAFTSAPTQKRSLPDTPRPPVTGPARQQVAVQRTPGSGRKVGIWIAAALAVLAGIIGTAVAVTQFGNKPTTGTGSSSTTPSESATRTAVVAGTYSSTAINAANVGDCVEATGLASADTNPRYVDVNTATCGGSPSAYQDSYWKVVRRTHDVSDCAADNAAVQASDTGLILCLEPEFGPSPYSHT